MGRDTWFLKHNTKKMNYKSYVLAKERSNKQKWCENQFDTQTLIAWNEWDCVTAWLIFFWISAFTLFFCLVLDGGALSRHLVPKKADEENSRQGVQAGQGEEQQVQFIDQVEKK